MQIPVDKIGEVIGPKGKVINQIQDDTGASLSIEDDGTIYIGATNGEAAEAARQAVNAIANPTMPEVGERYLGTVVKTTNFGAFVSLLPGKDGLLHISKLRGLAGGKRVEAVEDVVSVGQKIQVQIAEIDDRGKLSLIPVVEDADGSADEAEGTARLPSDQQLHSIGRPASRVLLAGCPFPRRPGSTRTLQTDPRRRRAGDLPGPPYRPAGRPAGGHRADGRRPLGQHRRLGRRRLARRDAVRCTAARTSSSTCCSRAPASRSALDISVALDAVGGEFNAFTAKEYTCFHARVLDDDLPLAVDVLGDMITDSLIAADDVEAERDVILDEIAMHDDDPDDVVHNLFAEQACGDAPLGRPIAGTVESITTLTRDQVARFYRGHYRPANMVVAAAGNVDHADGRAPGAHARSAATTSCRASEQPRGAASGRPRPPGPRRHRHTRAARSSRSTSCSE